ncbi:MAG: Si-specific NAD(P)(+) transhydrogenase [Alphaproteobacteria bacterium]|nr:Si-specific NAD(P)(+) transhydrogenase [Alphaproteobacteria bacterium]
MREKYDFIVVGSGPAGRRGAVQAAKAGRSVLVVERGRRIGGVSVHTGTIPSKTLRETVMNLSGWRERGFYGRAYKVKADITAADLRQRLHLTLDHEVDVLESQFARNRVATVRGDARFLDPHRIEVACDDDEKLVFEADKILLAVGTKPFRPTYMPFDGKRVLDSDEILEIEELPRSLVVIGAGVIGIEYATIFSALDVRVSLVEPRDTILDFVDRELVADFLHDLRDRGLDLRIGSSAKRVRVKRDGCAVRLDDRRLIRSDMVLFAAGRVGATDTLNLSACGLSVDHRGRLAVDKETYQTAVPHIYAAGDVIGFPSLASTSMEQGRIAACHAFGVAPPHAPEHFPYGIYTIPEMSTIGLTEEQLKAAGVPYERGVARFRETSRGQIMGLSTGTLKMLFDLETRRLLGVHILGEGATELVHIGQAVLNLHGTLDYFIDNTFNYPTLAEAYKIAALDAWNRMGAAEADEEAGLTGMAAE